MFRDLQQILRTAGIPLGDEELLDALWLVSRLPEAPDTPLAARLAAAQKAAQHLVEGAPPRPPTRLSRATTSRRRSRPVRTPPGTGPTPPAERRSLTPRD